MWLTYPRGVPVCGYPVEEPSPAAAVNMPADRSHAARPLPKREHLGQFADMLGQHLDAEGAEEFDDEINQLFHFDHRRMMALSA
jgi:hypothetical protein